MAFHKSSLLVSKFGLAEEAIEAIILSLEFWFYLVMAIIRFSINNLSYI